MSSGERLLWLSVLVTGLRDAASGADPYWPWSHDFAEVCDLAEVNASRVRTAFEINKAIGRGYLIK